MALNHSGTTQALPTMDASSPTAALALPTPNGTVMSMPIQDHYYSHPQTEMPSSTSTAKGDDYVCNVCKRSYTRADHLARHFRSHTREKPFSCSTCGKSFGRADLLKRHTQSHGPDGQKVWKRGRRDGSSAQPTSRVGKACVACASAKLKCGDEKPCRRCIQNDIHCVLPPANDRGHANNGSSQSIPLPGVGSLLDGDRTGTRGLVDDHEMDHAMDHRGSFDQSNPKQPNDLTAGQFHQVNYMPLENPVTNNTDVTQASTSSPQQDGNSMIGFDDSSLAGFLRDIMIPANSPNFQDHPMGATSHSYGLRDVFDFGIDTSLDFNDMDFDWIATFNSQAPISNPQLALDGDQPLTRGQQTPDIRNGLNLGAEAFQNSLWRWAPALRDNAYDAQENLLLSKKDAAQLDLSLLVEAPEHRLEYPSRDQILAMLVGTCDPANVSRVASSFPSTQVLSSLMHLYFKTQATSTDSWIHFPSFKPMNQRPELNAIIIAAGAVASSIPTVRKLGYALQEAVRLAIPKAWEGDNRLTRNLQLLQAYSLQLSIMVWSGNKRKMEIGESHAQPLITMMRRAGHYRKARSAPAPPRPEDTDEVLEAKWLQWIEYESFKRLAFHTLIHESQTSVAFLIRPLLSYSEVSLELPCSRMLWIAKDPQTWRDVYLNDIPETSNRLPSLLLCIHDTQRLMKIQHSTDFVMSTSIILHGIWGMIAEYLQLEHASKVKSEQRHWNGVLTSWHQELCQLLDHYHMSISEWDGVMPAETVMFQELCMMNLHVSFEELQIFAGMEGSEEAQNVYPILRTWKESRKARQAMWHAGQIVRAAISCHPSHLKSFCAIALYHASLAFWVYGMISIGTSRSRNLSHASYETAADSDLIWLDDSETPEMRRFIAINRGIPVIHDFGANNGEQQVPGFARLDHPRRVMDIIIKVLNRRSNADGPILSPLAENLAMLMRDLGKAAGIISSR